MALCGYLSIRITKRGHSSDFLDVCGKVVAKYIHTIGNYKLEEIKLEEILLFDKDPKFDQYERLPFRLGSNLLSSSRSWVAAPAYSSLLLDMDLFEANGEKIISIKGAELDTDDSYRSFKDFVSGDYFVSVYSSWFNTASLPPTKQDGFDHQISRNIGSMPSVMGSAIEVYSVRVYYEDPTRSMTLHGHLQFKTSYISDDFIKNGFDIVKIKQEKPLPLLGRGGNIPLLIDGSRVLPYNLPVSIVCDLKDTERGLIIKGCQIIREDLCLNRQLCSVFRGDKGFAALHFSIFRSAVQGHLDVFVYQPEGSQCAVFGSIFAQYKGLDYSTWYKNKWYSLVFFKKHPEDLVQMGADGLIPCSSEDMVPPMYADGSIPLSKFSLPLSRSSFLVPSISYAVFYLDLMIGTEHLTCKMNVTPSRDCMRFLLEKYGVELVFKWSEVK